MSEIPRPQPLVRLAVLLLAAACLVGVGPGASARSGDSGGRPHRWAGYAIPATGHAAGGWIGGYRVGDATLYLTTPQRRPNRAGLRDPHRVGDLPGTTASRPETARAAWILSKYGSYRDATQAAAVDASVYHLLAGPGWHVGAARGARRIRQSGDPASVRRFARIMLRQSSRSAGAYTARLDADGADLGGTVAVTLTVRDGHGRPAPGLPVTLAMAGAEPVTSVTADDGRAVARFAADARGWQAVTATVRRVPDHRLRLWKPRRGAQAGAAEGGARRTLVVSTQAPVRGPQTLSLAADPGQLVAGSTTRVVATVSGDTAPRAATATLHGPFATAALAGCTGASVGSVGAEVAGDGSYPLPAMTVTGGGYFAWWVSVDGTATSVPVSGCGAPVKVRSRAAVAVVAPASVARFDVVSAQVSLTGLPFGGPVDVTTTLYGPFGSAATAACSGNHQTVTQRRPGNGTFTSQSFQVNDPGWYVWQSSLPEGDLWVGATSPCGGTAAVTQVP